MQYTVREVCLSEIALQAITPWVRVTVLGGDNVRGGKGEGGSNQEEI